MQFISSPIVFTGTFMVAGCTFGDSVSERAGSSAAVQHCAKTA